MHRSGTTYLGNIFNLSHETFVFHEPYNRKYGIAGLPFDYINLEHNELAKIILSKIISKKPLNFVRRCYRDSLSKALIRIALGGKTENQWRLYRYLFQDRKLILKDPFLSKSTCYIGKNYGLKSIVLIRHPCAVWNSIKKMNWTDVIQ